MRPITPLSAQLGAHAGSQGEGSYSGYFTAEDTFHIDWGGTRNVQKGAMLFRNKN